MTVTSSAYSPRAGKEMSHALSPSSQQQQKTGPGTGDSVTYNMAPGSIQEDQLGQQEAQPRLLYSLCLLILGFPILSLKKNKSSRQLVTASKIWKGPQVPDKWLFCEWLLCVANFWLTSDCPIWPDEKVVLLNYVYVTKDSFKTYENIGIDLKMNSGVNSGVC